MIILSTVFGLSRTNEPANTKKPRVAVVGGGVGGTTAAFFLREELGEDVDITLYEQAKIGGRTATVEIGGRFYEAGKLIGWVDKIRTSNVSAKQSTVQFFGGRLNNRHLLKG